MRTVAIAFLLFTQLALAAPLLKHVAVFETLTDADSVLSDAELNYLTNELRKQAVTYLPVGEYSVMTRDNIMALLPPDKNAAECFEGACLVEVGRNVGADYAVQGTVSKFGGKLTLTTEAYETMGATLMGSFTAESPDANGLLEAIRKDSPLLFSKISGKPLDAIANADSAALATAIAAAVAQATPQQVVIDNGIKWGELTKSFLKTNWIGYTLDVVGLAGIGTAIYMNHRMDRKHEEYKKLTRNPTGDPAAFNAAWDKVEKAKLYRNIGYIAGGTLLAGGVTMHILF
jgi:hypothetical protein